MKMKKVLALVLAALMMISLVACGQNSNNNPPGGGNNPGNTPGTDGPGGSTDDPGNDPADSIYGGVLDIATHQDTGLDPHATSGAEMYKWSALVYENPLALDQGGNISPNVCEFDLSDDGLTLKLWVRDGMTFHDGSPVEIEDVVASLERAGKLASNVKKYFAGYMANLEVADGVATYTFEKYSPNTVYYIAVLQTWAAVLPKEVCEKYGEEMITDAADAIGTGPYKLTSYEPGIGYKTVRYDNYVKLEGYTGEAGPKMAYMDAINLWINQDETSMFTAFMNGDYDITNLSEVDYNQTMLQMGGYKIFGLASAKTLYLAFNTKGDRPVNDANLRKAIACLVNLADFATLQGAGITFDPSPIPEGNQYHSDLFKDADYLGTGTEMAQKYLDASNYNGEEIVILAAKNEKLCVLLESYLSDFGLNVKLDYTSDESYYLDNSNPYDIMIAGATMVASYPALVPAALKNTYWGNARKDELFKALDNEPIGSVASLEMWDELVDLWIDDASIVMLYSYSGNGSTIREELYPNNPGMFFNVFYNTYWTNPSEHMN